MAAKARVHEELSGASPPRLAVNFVPLLRGLTVRGLGIMDIIRIIESHAVIVARLIALANSAWSNPAKPITGLQQACTRLGLDVVRTVAIATCVSRSFSVGLCRNFDPVLHWIAALLTSEVCGELADSVHLDAGSARTAGLMHNIGILWLAELYPEKANAALAEWDPAEPWNLDRVMAHHTGIGYAPASRILIAKMGLPEAIRTYLDEDPPDASGFTPPAILRTAAGIAGCVLHGERDLAHVTHGSPFPLDRIATLFEHCQGRLDGCRQQAALLCSG